MLDNYQNMQATHTVIINIYIYIYIDSLVYNSGPRRGQGPGPFAQAPKYNGHLENHF